MRLVTIATFDEGTKAHLAHEILTGAGIQAVLSDEATVGMNMILGNALGWVKLQVREEDADKAVDVLDRSLGSGDERNDAEVSREAEATAPEEGESALEQQARTTTSSNADGAESPYAPRPGSREDYARRLFFTAWFAVFLPPIAFVALYMLLKAAFGSGPLSSRGRYNLLIGGFFTVISIVWASLFFVFFILGVFN